MTARRSHVARVRLRRRRLFIGLVSTLALACVAALHAGPALIVHGDPGSPDAILSLASHEWERLPEVARLAQKCPHCPVLLTRPMVVSRANCHDCARRIDNLSALGVAPERIVVLPMGAWNTYGEAIAARPTLLAAGRRHVIVVTSPYHMRRALATFRTVLKNDGIAVSVAGGFAESGATPDRWWARSYDRAYVTYEWLAIVAYRFKHGVPVSPG